MKKIKRVIGAAMLFLICGKPAFADIPNNSLVIGNKGFSMEYANKKENVDEIKSLMDNENGEYYIKNDKGEWSDSKNKKKVPDEWIPRVIYKDTDGSERYFLDSDGEEIDIHENTAEDIIENAKLGYGVREYKGWLYYTKRSKFGLTIDSRLHRIRKDGTGDMSLGAQGYIYDIKDDWIYFRNSGLSYSGSRSNDYKMRLDGSEKIKEEYNYDFTYESEVVAESDKYEYLILDGALYRSVKGEEDKEEIMYFEDYDYSYDYEVLKVEDWAYVRDWSRIFMINLKNDEVKEIKLEFEIKHGDYIYASDMDGDSSLYRMKIGTDEKELVIKGQEDDYFYIVGTTDDAIYLYDGWDYENEYSENLYKLSINDGFKKTLLAKGVSVDLTRDECVYYTDKNKRVYRLTYGSDKKSYIDRDIEFNYFMSYNQDVIYKRNSNSTHYWIKDDNIVKNKIAKGEFEFRQGENDVIYLYDDLDALNEGKDDYEKNYAMSVYKYDFKEKKLDTIMKGVDCSRAEYLQKSNLGLPEEHRENPLFDLVILDELNVTNPLYSGDKLKKIMEKNNEPEKLYMVQMKFPERINIESEEGDSIEVQQFLEVIESVNKELSVDDQEKYIIDLDYRYKSYGGILRVYEYVIYFERVKELEEVQ